jgi:septal ring factor EnvC (AmiA/AmiB activator)
MTRTGDYMDELPIFVKIEDYSTTLSALQKSMDRLEESKEIISRLSALRTKEDDEIRILQEELDAIELRISELHDKLKQPSRE